MSGCKYLRQFHGTSFCVANWLICCNINMGGGGCFISANWIIPEFQRFFPEIDFVSIIYMSTCILKLKRYASQSGFFILKKIILLTQK